MRAASIDGAHLEKRFDRFNYRIYAFDTPMQPGETGRCDLPPRYEQRGFSNSDNEHRVVDNGTFVNNGDIAPMHRHGPQRPAQDPDQAPPIRAARSKLRPPKLEDDSARAHNYIGHDADWVTSDITVTTVADQIPIAPGYKVSETVANGRRTVRFVTDSPILHFFSVQSAAIAVKRDQLAQASISPSITTRSIPTMSTA